MPGMTLSLVLTITREISASMRPRLNAGDDTALRADADLEADRFNEAPAKCRG